MEKKCEHHDCYSISASYISIYINIDIYIYTCVYIYNAHIQAQAKPLKDPTRTTASLYTKPHRCWPGWLCPWDIPPHQRCGTLVESCWSDQVRNIYEKVFQRVSMSIWGRNVFFPSYSCSCYSWLSHLKTSQSLWKPTSTLAPQSSRFLVVQAQNGPWKPRFSHTRIYHGSSWNGGTPKSSISRFIGLV